MSSVPNCEEGLAERLRPVSSRTDLQKLCSGDRESPQQSCLTAADISSEAISEAGIDRSPEHSLGRSASPDLKAGGSQLCGPELAVRIAGRLQGSGNVRLWNLATMSQWEDVAERLDASLAAVLQSRVEVTSSRLRARDSAVAEDMGGLYLRYDEEAAVTTLSDILREGLLTSSHKVHCLERTKALEAKPTQGQKLGHAWTFPLLLPDPSSAPAKLAEQVSMALRRSPLSDLQPATDEAYSPNWLAYSRAGRQATDLQLQGGGPTWVSGFTKSPSALQPVYLLLPVGALTQAVLEQHEVEQYSWRRWVIQQDESALAATELVLRSWRAEASGGAPATTSHCWEETDSRAVVFGPKNALGTCTEILQKPGQLLSLQRQGHCSWVSSGVFLKWNVAIGADWAGHALREVRIRCSAVRAMAAAHQNPWLGAELQRPSSLHVLRLLFAAVCSIPQVHDSILEGLQDHFVALCKAELQTQAETTLPQLNMQKGCLESDIPSTLRCSCCCGEFLFSCVRLIERSDERGGDFCWQCWKDRRRIGLELRDGPPRNARNCTAFSPQDVQCLVTVLESTRPSKRQRVT